MARNTARWCVVLGFNIYTFFWIKWNRYTFFWLLPDKKHLRNVRLTPAFELTFHVALQDHDARVGHVRPRPSLVLIDASEHGGSEGSLSEWKVEFPP